MGLRNLRRLVTKEGTNIAPNVGLGVLLCDSSGEKDAGACLRVSVLEARMKPQPSPNWGNIRLAWNLPFRPFPGKMG